MQLRFAPSPLALVCLACAVSGCDVYDIDARAEVRVSEEIPTVATVRWETVLGDVDGAFVDFGPDRDYGRRARATVDAEGTATAYLLGMKPKQRYRFRVVEVVDGEWFKGPRETLRTGKLTPDLPEISVDSEGGGEAHAGFLVTAILAQPSVAVIVDEDGDYVWAHQPSVAWDNLFISRVVLSHHSNSVLYHAATTPGGMDSGGITERILVRVSLDGSQQDHVVANGIHHDFVELDGGALAAIKRDRRTIDGENVDGDRIVEIDADGDETTLWSVWDHFEYDPDAWVEPGTTWCHANALDLVNEEDAYYLSLRNLDAIVKIDRWTGETLWILGGDSSDFSDGGGGSTFFRHQHQFEVLDGGILVFDNGVASDLSSRVVEITLDEAAGRAEAVWEYEPDPPLYSMALGDVARLPSDNTLVTFSSAGQVEEVTPDGDVVWRLNTDLGSAIGYATWREALFDANGPAGADMQLSSRVE